MLEKHLGGILGPPSSYERLTELGPFTEQTFEVAGRGWDEAAADIVLPGLGWVTVLRSLELTGCKPDELPLHVLNDGDQPNTDVPRAVSQVTGSGQCTISVGVPDGVGVTMREPVIVGEAWKAMAKFTGSKIVDLRGKMKRRR